MLSDEADLADPSPNDAQIATAGRLGRCGPTTLIASTGLLL
jgi:hypothetical protein